MKLPNLIVAGAQKSGTTGLFQLLSLHPDIFMAEDKELSFFIGKDTVSDEQLAAYAENFKNAGDQRYIGEATPGYFWARDPSNKYSPKNILWNIPELIASTLGNDIRIILSLRNPVDRAISAYHHHYMRGRIPEGQSPLDTDSNWGIVDLGFYQRHYLQWQAIFPKEGLITTLYDDMVADTRAYFGGVCERLGLDFDPDGPSYKNYKFKKPVHSKASSQKSFNVDTLPPIPEEAIRALVDIYSEDIGFCEDLMQRDLSHWRDVDAIIALNS